MKHSEFQKQFNILCNKMMSDVAKKNADYAGQSHSAFHNFQMVEAFDACSAEIGIFTRLTDKYARILSFIKKRAYKVKSESIQDTCVDAAVYFLILAIYLKDKK